MKFIYISILTCLALFSCKKDKNIAEDGHAFLGGEIINPNGNFVVISESETPIDTILLDANNRFLYKIEDLKPTIYRFTHGNEFQMILIEPNDSIMFRVNTMDFDESLVFTGIGAKKNNYLINLFIEEEAEEKTFLKFSKLAPETFQQRMDSLRQIKLDKLNRFKDKHDISDASLFSRLAQANIDYNYYSSKEVYPFIYFGYSNIKKIETLPADFYDYRKDINYNDEFLKDYFSYYGFLRNHFNNLALNDYLKQSESCMFNRKSLIYNETKLNLIDSLVTQEDIKNSLLWDSTINYLDNNPDEESYDVILKSFIDKSTNKYHNQKITSFVNALKGLKTGNSIPNLKVIDHKGTAMYLNEVIKRPTVFYFWLQAIAGHFKESHYKIKDLKEKYPEIDFVGINLNKGERKLWVKALQQYNFPVENEYQFENLYRARQSLALHALAKVIIVNKDGSIVNSNVNMFDPKFEQHLLGLINQ